jgi:hypothetical protein
MPEPTLSMALSADDDLPRAIRREREARERQARERELREQQTRERHAAAARVLDPGGDLDRPAPAVTVTAFDVPFTRLAAFFIRAAFAAIPALLIVMAFLWVLGQGLQTFFPQLLKMKILIYVP